MLVGRMRYLEDELVDLPVDDVADEHIPDRVEDVRPFVYKVKEGDDEEGANEEVRLVDAPSFPAAVMARHGYMSGPTVLNGVSPGHGMDDPKVLRHLAGFSCHRFRGRNSAAADQHH